MRYYYELNTELDIPKYSILYHGPFEFFDLGTLYLIDGLGLIVVMPEFNRVDKTIKFGPLPPSLANDIYEQPGFREFFLRFAQPATPSGEYPVMNVCKIMWSLRMKPLRKMDWEQKLQALL